MDASIREFPLPEAFVQRAREQLKDELPAFLKEINQSPVRGLRKNPYRNQENISYSDLIRKIPWEEYGWELSPESNAGTTIAHEAGAFYLQEPAAMLPAAVMDPKPGESILDLCAAPGGKSTQMGLRMKGEGLLISNDPIPARAAILSRNLERMGVPNSIVTCAYPQSLTDRWADSFDGVLVDAPCSGEGMFRRLPESRAEWTMEKAAGCAARQREILFSAARMVRPGGRLVYSTCTWNPAENEEQIGTFLKHFPEFEPEPFLLPGISAPEGYYTCWPHRIQGEGQFAALLRRKGETERTIPEGKGEFRMDKDSFRIWKESGIRTVQPNVKYGNILAWLPFVPELTGIRIFRLGLHLGQIRGKNFFPDHAAAIGIIRPEMDETVLSDSNALAWFTGDTIPGNAAGWTLMTWNGLVLGWGKGSGGTIRNHYPKGLRNGRLTV